MALVFVVASDVACPLLSGFALPICVPPDTHPWPAVTSLGWHRKNVTVPVGIGPTPDTVAVSVTDVPGTTAAEFVLAWVVVVEACGTVLKHSLVASVWLELK